MGLTAAAYIGTVRFEFVYDDEGQIIGNSYIQFWRHVPKYFISQVWAHIFPAQRGNYYRPLFLLWLRVNDACFGLNPKGWHAAALGLHLVATLLVYFIFRKMVRNPSVAAMGALIFGVHPIHAEVVAWVSGATESLLAVFFLAAFLSYLKSREGNSAIWMTVSCIFFGLAVFSKETGIVLPAMVFGYAWIYGPPSGVAEEAAPASSAQRLAQVPAQNLLLRFLNSLRATLPYWPVALFYLFARILVLHGFGHPTVRLGWRTILFTMPSMAAFYLKKWFLPVRLTEFYDLYYFSGWNFWHVFLPVLSIAIVALALWLFRRQLGSREVAFCALWMVVPILPVLDTAVLPLSDIVHDRYFYLPSLGAALLVALAIDWIIRPAGGESAAQAPANSRLLPAYVLTFIVLGGTLAALSAHEAQFWANDITLFGRAHTLAPRNPIARNNYGVELAALGYDQAARAIFQEAVAADPNDWASYFNLGRISYQEKKYPEAEMWLLRANALNYTAPDVYIDLGLVQLRTNRVPEALASMHRAVELRPNDPTFLFAYGVVLAQSGDCTAARVQFRQALDIRPGEGMTQMVLDRCEQIAPQR
jgi:protein O-mannosyl-transferase